MDLLRAHAHLTWADRRALASIRTCPEPTEELVALAGHLIGTEEVWLARLEARAPDVAVWPTGTLDDHERTAQRTHARLEAYLRTVDDDERRRVVPYTNSAGGSFENTVDDLLAHLFHHGSYHRGQIATLVRRAGGEPASTDLVAWVRGAPAATRRP